MENSKALEVDSGTAVPSSGLVFYFSGTGNSRHVARRVAEAVGVHCVAMDECLRSGRLHFQLDGKALVGFVFPVYFWGLPTIVREFLQRVKFSVAPVWLFDVATFGTTLGEVHYQFRKEAEARGWDVGGSYGVKMVDVWTPMFDVSDPVRNQRRTVAAEPQIDRVIEYVLARQNGPRHWSSFPHWLACLYYRSYERQRRTEGFRLLKDRCTACGKCIRQCPVQALAASATDGKPYWQKPQCAVCLRCLHHCPQFAIQYGKHTLKHGQFVHPDK